MRSDYDVDALKDSLFSDSDLVHFVADYGLDETLQIIREFRVDVAEQLRYDAETKAFSSKDPAWGRRATALVIRAKERIRLLEDVERME